MRFARGLVAAWPEGNLDDATVRSDVRLRIGEENGETYLCIGLGGSEAWVGWDGSEEEATEAVDQEVIRLADDLEGDRWSAGDGWKEYRS